MFDRLFFMLWLEAKQLLYAHLNMFFDGLETVLR